MRGRYSLDVSGGEVQAPWGYYQPLELAEADFAGKRVLYTLGSACIEASCCGKGSWTYARVEGYAIEGSTPAPADPADPADPGEAELGSIEVDTVEDAQEKAAIAQLLLAKHPGIRVEFR